MAADQRRKRISSANVIGFSSREHYRAKRKKIGSPDDGALRLRDRISLEWDGNRSKVVSKKEQVGLSLRHLREFVDFVPSRRRSLLAQVCPVPHETFQLENLSEVLSTEVWRSCLSDGERNYLQQFLPEGIDVEQVVEQLLDGDNFHFGNPFLDWGTSVCSGKAHPDLIVSQEECLRAAKRRYYADLEKYHNDIIDSLQLLKEKWVSCKDPEKDALYMWGRSSEGNANVNGSCHDLIAASECSSRDADDKPCNSDRSGEIQRRPKSSAVEKEKSQSPLITPENVVNEGVKARKNDKLPKHSIQQTDGAKYMSYLKISKKQYQIVTSMKQSGKSIQLRALNRILGNIGNLDVQPYGMFVEEEQKKLNAHWLQLVRDLPAAYAIWKKLQSQKRDVINSVGRELKDKLNPWMEDKQLHSALQRHDVQLDLRRNDPESLNSNQSGSLAPEDEDSGSFGQVNAKRHSLSEDSSSDVDQIPGSGRCLQVGTYPSQVSSPDCDNGNLAGIEENKYSSPSRCHGLNRKDVEANEYSSSIQSQSLPQASNLKNCVSEVENASTFERMIPCNNTSSHGEELQFLSGGDVWQPVGGIRQSYIGRQAYTPTGGLSIIHHPEGGGEEEKNCFIHLESDMPEEVDRRKIQNEVLLQSLFKGQGVASGTTEQLHSLNVPLNEEHKQIMNIGFQQEGSNNVMEEGNQFPGQFQHQMTAPQALSQNQQRRVDIYGQGSMSDNIYCDGRGFLMQRPDWNNTSVPQIGVTTQPLLNTGPLLNQNWQFKSMWTNTDRVGCVSQNRHTGTERDLNLLRAATNAEPIIHRGISSDQSLFSVFSQRRSSSTFEPESSSDQVFESGNNERLMEGGTAQVGSSLAQPTNNPLDYLSGSNPVASLMPEDVTWMNNRQNSGLHDPLGKLYPRSWNP